MTTNPPISWHEGIPLILKNKIQETHDTVSFLFGTNEPCFFEFKSGQFVTLKVQIDQQICARAYSISSLPKENTLQLTIKRVNEGMVSNWLIDHLQVGMSLSTYGIAGEFNLIDCPPKDKILLVSAGCGITPVMSMAKYILQNAQNSTRSIKFLHCARDEDNLIFEQEIQKLSEQYPQFSAYYILENKKSDRLLKENEAEGLLDEAKLAQFFPDLKEHTVYLCGPTGFMNLVNTLLEKNQFDPKNFFQESFTPSRDSISAPLASSGNQTVSLSVPAFGVQKDDIPVDANLLEVLEMNKVPVIGACRSGVCGSCKCQVTQGNVESSSTATLTEQQIKDGYVLACSSKIKTDVEIKL